jgi:hypothetical protein
MPKHLAALLSILGFTGSTIPATAQVLKGSKEAAATTAETKVKTDKTKKGVLIGLSKAGKGDAERKHKKNLTEGQAAKTEALQHGGEVSGGHIKKGLKASAETNAIQSGIQDKRKKVSAETTASHEDKWDKANAHMGDGSVRNATVGGGGGAGKVSVSDVTVKSDKNAAEAQAAGSQASKKAAKASAAPKQ